MDKCENPTEFDDRFDDGETPYVSPYPEEDDNSTPADGGG
jgi:hypothetical protein